MAVYEKIYLEAYINNQYIWPKNTVQLYFILGRVDLHYNFASLLSDTPDIHRFATVHMVKSINHLLLENLWI